MSYCIIGDSCTDLTAEQRKNGEFELVPLSLEVEDEVFIDDETFDQKKFISRMAASKSCPKSACPAPEAYMAYFDKADDCYIVTLSARLSGSCNSAQLAKKLYKEEHPDKNIAVIDSKSASVGQTLIAMKIKEYAEEGLPFAEIQKKAEEFRDEMDTMFILESLDNLIKNGRLSKLKARIVNTLNIKPIMGATKEGEIDKRDQARGMKRSLAKMAEMIAAGAKDPEGLILGIAHCNNYEKALYLKEEVEKKVKFKDIFIVDTAGVSTLYANDGGIIASF